jgi:glutaredoxin
MVDGRLLFIMFMVALAAILLALNVAHLGGPGGQAPAGAGCSGESGGVCVPASGVYFVIIGTEGCPHCRAMKEFLPSIGADTYFCEIMRSGSVCAKAYMELVTEGITQGVPVIAACSNTSKQLLFIEIGEYRNATWWRLAVASPSGSPAVYEAGKRVSDLDPVLAEKLYRLLCVEALRDAEKLKG